MNFIPLDECVPGRLYRLHSRNLKFGVFVDHERGGFIGLRTKFGDRYMFTEYHREKGAPFGTVRPLEDLGLDVPKGVELVESLGSEDEVTGRRVAFDRPQTEGGKGWYFEDTGVPSPDIRAFSIRNKELFDWLVQRENEDTPWIIEWEVLDQSYKCRAWFLNRLTGEVEELGEFDYPAAAVHQTEADLEAKNQAHREKKG